MPEAIIKKFQKKYGKKAGKSIFYATANKQKRDPETFEKRSLREAVEDLFASGGAVNEGPGVARR